MPRPATPFDVNDAMQRYLAGEGLHKIACELRVAPRRLRGALRNAGVTMRTHSEWLKMSWTVMDARDHARRLRIIEETNRKTHTGKRHGMDQRKRHAATLSGRDPNIIPKHELGLRDELDGHGVRADWQFAIGPYLTDLAIREPRVAVEIQRSHWNLSSVPGRSMHPERLEYILNAGWSILVVYCPPIRRKPVIVGGTVVRPAECIERFDRGAVADKVIAFCDVARGLPSGGSQYGVIGGDAKPSSVFRLKLDGRTRVPGF